MAVSKRTRYEVLHRDGHRCRYCGQGAPDVPMTVDHVVPKTLGGSDKPDNLVAACKDCNAGKSSVPPDAAQVADVQQDALRWSMAMEQVLEQRAAELAADRARYEVFDRKWRSYVRTSDNTPIPRDVNWKSSLSRFFASGLDDEFLADAVDKAAGLTKVPVDEKWRYFCGICWTEIDGLIARTRELAGRRQTAPTPAPGGGQVMPQGAGLDPTFDPLNLTDSFLAEVLHVLNAASEDRTEIHRAYWDAMQEAYRVHTAGETFKDVPLEDWVQEQFSNVTAPSLARVGRSPEQLLHVFLAKSLTRELLERYIDPDLADEIAKVVPECIGAGVRAYSEASTREDEFVDERGARFLAAVAMGDRVVELLGEAASDGEVTV